MLSRKMKGCWRDMKAPQFRLLLGCARERVVVRAGEERMREKESRVDCLSLVLAGAFTVSQAGRSLHTVTHTQFLDSPEWFGVSTDELFQVTVTAVEDSELLVWHRDKLKFALMADPRLQVLFDHVVARDVVRKLMQVLIYRLPTHKFKPQNANCSDFWPSGRATCEQN